MRLLLITRMRQGGVSSLGGTTMQMSAFTEAFPDQKDWVSKLLQSTKSETAETVAGFREKFSLQGIKPEYLTMLLCIMGSSCLQSNFHELCRKKLQDWITFKKKYRSMHNLDVHPAVLQKEA